MTLTKVKRSLRMLRFSSNLSRWVSEWTMSWSDSNRLSKNNSRCQSFARGSKLRWVKRSRSWIISLLSIATQSMSEILYLPPLLQLSISASSTTRRIVKGRVRPVLSYLKLTSEDLWSNPLAATTTIRKISTWRQMPHLLSVMKLKTLTNKFPTTTSPATPPSIYHSIMCRLARSTTMESPLSKVSLPRTRSARETSWGIGLRWQDIQTQRSLHHKISRTSLSKRITTLPTSKSITVRCIPRKPHPS